MNRTSYFVSVSLLVLGIAAVFGFLPQCLAQSTGIQPYRIGVIIPLSGSQASWGKYARQGIDLAHSRLPEDLRRHVEVIYEDDQFESKKTVSIYHRLSSTPGINAVFVLGSPPANAIGPLCEKDGRILMAIGASDASIAVGKEYSFIHWVTPPVLAETLVGELAQRDFKKIALIVSEATGAIADADAVKESLKARSLESRLVFYDTFPKEETDFRTTIAMLRQKKPDAVVLVLFPGSLAPFAMQYRAAGLTGELIGMETFEDESEIKAAQGALNNTWYVNASDPSAEFVAEYKKRYGEHPGWAAGNAYDSLMLLAQAARASGSGNIKVRDYLRAVKGYSGAAGNYSASGDNRFTLPAALKRVKNHGFEPLR